MITTPVTLLLIENDPTDATLVQNALATQETLYRVIWVTSLAAALDYLTKNTCDIVFLDLMLPDSSGLDTFDKVAACAPFASVVILSSGNDDDLIQAALQRGARDHIAKGQMDPYWLPRMLNYVLERDTSYRARVESDKRFFTVSEVLPVGVFVADVQGNCVYTNPAYQRLSGLSFADALGSQWIIAIHPDEREQVFTDWNQAVHHQKTFTAEFRFVRNGKPLWVRVQAAVIHNVDNKTVQGYVQIVEDISDRKAMETIVRVSEDALFDQLERAQVTLNSIGDAVLTTNLAGQVSYLNPVAEAMTGWPAQEALGLPLKKVFRVIDADTRRPSDDSIKRAVKENKTIKLPQNCLLIRRDGTEIPIVDSTAPIHNRDGAVTGAVIVFHDVSESHAVAKKLMHMAQHDVLTGLPNRALLTERLTRALEFAKRKQKTIALLFIDIDNFKQINDSRGHAMGDRLLQSIAQRLLSIVRVTDTVCRQGGDEFVVLLPEIEHVQDAAHVAEKMIVAFAEPQLVHDQAIPITLSIGICLYPHDGSDVDTLFQRADAAMYRAKENGRNNYQFYSSDCDVKVDGTYHAARAAHDLPAVHEVRSAHPPYTRKPS